MNRCSLLLSLVNLLAHLWLKIGIVEGIVGGQEAELGRFKYMVSVQRKYGHICGGAIVDEFHVLTAAHCVIERKDNSFADEKLRVLGGVTDLQNEEEVKRGIWAVVEKAYVPAEYVHDPLHKYYTYSEKGDIAVLKLKEKLILGKDAILDKVNLPIYKNCRYHMYLKRIGAVTGFGVDNAASRGGMRVRKDMDNIRPVGKKLKFIEVTILRKDSCNSRWIGSTIEDIHVCAQANQNDPKNPEGTCDGDTGSPLVVDGDTLVGILSNNRPNCNEKWHPSIYTRITEYTVFILSAMKNTVSSSIRAATYQSMHVLEIVTTFEALVKNSHPGPSNKG